MNELNLETFYKLVRFGITGLIGMVVDFGITWVCREKFRLNQYIANSTGFLCAVVSNYILNRVWTFHSQDPLVMMQFSKFLLASLIGLGINNGIIYLLNERLGMKFYTSKLIATGVVMLWNFWANYTFTFRA